MRESDGPLRHIMPKKKDFLFQWLMVDLSWACCHCQRFQMCPLRPDILRMVQGSLGESINKVVGNYEWINE